jgi:hypothetical protein
MPDDAVTLTSWAIHHGCTFHYLQISIHEEYGGYGLFNSTSTTAADDDIVRAALFIPNSLIISIDLISEAAEESEELADVLNVLPPLQNLEPIITVFLLYQVYLQRHGIPSKWSIYIDHLPKSSLLPMTWNKNEINFLIQSSTSISRAVPAKLAFLKSIYETLKVSSEWFQSITWNDYILAESWVSSRTVECPRTSTPLLIPILDMANHSTSRNAAWEVTDGGIELRREPVDIAAGEELTISYDLDRGTGERLYRYGFLEEAYLNVPTKEITLLDPSPPRLPGGNVYRINLNSVRGGFSNLSFLTYENWYAISHYILT